MISRLMSATAALGLLGLSAAAAQEGFHGFEPGTFDGAMLPEEEPPGRWSRTAQAATPPKNGEAYVVGFANLQRDIPFAVLVEEGIVENAEAAGIELIVTDNRLDGATALANAQSYINRDVDYVIEFQTDAAFGATIMQQMEAAGIPVIAIDIPMPGARFFGVNNPRAGFMGGSFLAQAATREFGEDAVREGYLIQGELPQSGPIPKMRTDGQVAGFLSQLEGFPEDQILRFDSKNTLEESFTQANSLIGRIPEGVPIMATAINDQSATGILRAIQQAGREDDAIVVGARRRRAPDADGRRAVRGLGGLLPRALRQLADPHGARGSGRRGRLGRGAHQPRHGHAAERLRVLPRHGVRRGRGRSTTASPRRPSTRIWPPSRTTLSSRRCRTSSPSSERGPARRGDRGDAPPARDARHRQELRRGARAGGRVARGRAGRGGGALGRQRGGQVHADEDPDGRLRARRGGD